MKICLYFTLGNNYVENCGSKGLLIAAKCCPLLYKLTINFLTQRKHVLMRKLKDESLGLLGYGELSQTANLPAEVNKSRISE